MEKLRFTQLFRESEKELSPEEKLEIIKKALPDEADKIDKDYDEALQDDVVEDFFKRYQDILDSNKVDDEDGNEDENANDSDTTNEATTSDETIDGEGVEESTELKVNNTDKNADDEVEETDDKSFDKQQLKSVKGAAIKKNKSSLEITNKYDEALRKTLNITPEMEKDFAGYEEYFGYTSSGKKDSVKVMFKTPDTWPIQTGDFVKKDDPLFHTVACMNEFLIWKMGSQIYNNNKKINSILDAIFETKMVGTELNRHIKSQSEKTTSKLGEAKREIETGSTPIDDPSESGRTIDQKNNLLIFMFTKIFPTILRTAKTGKVGGQGSCTARVFGNDNLYGKLYKIGRGDTNIEASDELTDLIIDSYNAFLGGRVAIRAPYERNINGMALIGTANAKPLCIFDTGWLNNESATAKNVFLKMDTAFSEKNPEIGKFEIRNTRKPKGKGATQAIGLSAEAYALAAKGVTDKELAEMVKYGEITQDLANEVLKARINVTIENVEIEPFTVIALTVGADFRNFLSCMTRVGARRADVFELYKKRYWSQEDIENEKDPKKKAEMEADNALWASKRTQIINFDPMSLNAPTTGKDGETGEFGDKIAAPSTDKQSLLKMMLPKSFDDIEFELKNMKLRLKTSIEHGNTPEIGRNYFSLLKMEQALWAGFKYLALSPIEAFNYAIGFEVRTDKKGNQVRDKGRIKTANFTSLASKTLGGKTLNGTSSLPYFGVGNLSMDERKPHIIDSVHKLRNSDGIWFLTKTPEGNLLRKNFCTYLENDYSENLADFKEFVRPIQGKRTTDDVDLAEFINTLNLNQELWGAGDSIMPDRIDQPAIGGDRDDLIAKQNDTSNVCPWAKRLLAGPVNEESLINLIDPKNLPDSPEGQKLVDDIYNLTGIFLPNFWDSKKHDGKGGIKMSELNNAIKLWNKTHDDKLQIFGDAFGTGTLGNEFTKNRPDVATAGNFHIKNVKHVNPKDGKPFDRTRYLFTSRDNLTKGENPVNYDILTDSLETFFGEVFREASAKETLKKQRFTIN